MARARNIKPGFFKNETLVELPFEHRLLFVGLWTLADREGRLEDRPKRIKMELFPCDSVDVEQGLSLLEKHGFIKRYSVGGYDIVQVIAFTKHQSPHHTEKASSLPDINGEITVKSRKQDGGNPPDSLIPDSLIPDSPNTEKESGSIEPDAGKPASLQSSSTKLDYSSWPEMPSPQVLTDWLAMRKRLKANVSQTVINQFGKELWLAYGSGYTVDDCLGECITSNWKGFKFSWLKNREAQHAGNQLTARPTRSQQAEQAHRDYIAELDRRIEREEAEAAGGYVAGAVEPPPCD